MFRQIFLQNDGQFAGLPERTDSPFARCFDLFCFDFRHPDKNSDPSANEKFMKINEAYEVSASSL